MIDPAELAIAMQDPAKRAALLVDLERVKIRRSLANFVKLAFRHIEPNRLVWNWHLDAMSELLEAVSLGQVRNLLINIPPGCMKSLQVSTLYPAWDWIENTSRRFIGSTYNERLTLKNALLHRNLVQSQWYQDRFPHVMLTSEGGKAASFFKNTAGGFRFSTSVGGSAIGFHGDVIISDDLVDTKSADGRAIVNVSMRKLEAALDHRFKTLVTRRADPNTTAFVTIMQRLHHQDPAQKCIDDGDHVCLILPMEYDPRHKCTIDLGRGRFKFKDPRKKEGELLWPERFDKATVATLRRDLGPTGAAAQLDQRPTPREGAIFKTKHMQQHWKGPELPCKALILTVDCSFRDLATSDYVVAQVWGRAGANYYLIDQARGQWRVTQTAAQIAMMKHKYKSHGLGAVHIEAAANGFATEQILAEQGHSGIQLWKPGRSSKIERAEATAFLWEAGNVFLPEENSAGWLADYRTEMARFPLGANDDQVDATTMALLILHGNSTEGYKAAWKNV